MLDDHDLLRILLCIVHDIWMYEMEQLDGKCSETLYFFSLAQARQYCPGRSHAGCEIGGIHILKTRYENNVDIVVVEHVQVAFKVLQVLDLCRASIRLAYVA